MTRNNNNGATFNLKCIGGNMKNIEKAADARSDSMEMEFLTNKRKCCDICEFTCGNLSENAVQQLYVDLL